MIRLECDYNAGALPEVLDAIVQTNTEQTCGYGEDIYCDRARKKIIEKCQNDKVAVHFVVGGTQANALLIASALRPHEAVLSADTGHINVHETGAIEATGHKVMSLPSVDGKINATQIEQAYHAHHNDSTHEHMTKPAMVYISHPTENGTLYSLAELTAISAVCKVCDLLLFVDGARLGYGMAALPEVDYAALAMYTDAFSIGGTKVGLLFGEALVISHPSLQKDFRYMMKQRGAMLAKGRLLGVQFDVLMQDDYYLTQASRANDYAQRIKQKCLQHGLPLLSDTICNQVFPIFPDALLAVLEKEFAFSYWQRIDETHSAIRFCPSVLTPESDINALLTFIDGLFPCNQ